VSDIRLECTQEIIPVVVPYDKQSVLKFPLDAVQDDAAVQWFDDRVVAFVKTYMAVMSQDAVLMRLSRRGLPVRRPSIAITGSSC
jgi:hypothetical protein